MMTAVIDYGNTSAKIGIFADGILKEKGIVSEIDEALSFLQNYSGEAIIISSVNIHIDLNKWLERRFKRVVHLTSDTPLPIKNAYRSKATLGMDRIAAACGARALSPDRNLLVIDAGTCITYDIVTSDGTFVGGAIAPGLRMRFMAMHNFTRRLPLLEPEMLPRLTGDDTASCMQSGVFFGIVDEIEGKIARYKAIYSDLEVILCGGDTPFFENSLKASIFASPELVLKGLNSILLYNVDL